MAHTLPPTYVAVRSFSDFDALAAEARQWDLDLRQLDRGKFRGELVQFGVDDVHITEARFGRILKQQGTPPAGLRTIGVPASGDTQFVWRGQRVTGDNIMVFPRGAELSGVSGPNVRLYTTSFPEHLLATVSETLDLRELDDLRGENEVVRCTSMELTSVRRCLKDLCHCIRGKPRELANQAVIDRLRFDLPCRLLEAIGGSQGSSVPATSRKRELALARAQAEIENCRGEAVTVGDLCRAAKVSQRTLEYAFAERFGVTPEAFLIAHRLNAVRRQLSSADPSTEKVVEIANSWGFWHMGQFAADYRRHFGELPSQTLRRIST